MKKEETEKPKIIKRKPGEIKGTFLILLTALISGLAIVVNRFFVVKIDPLIFTATRALFIGIIFFLISFFISISKKESFNKVSWKYLISLGIIGGSFAFWLFFAGLKATTAGRAAFIHKTLPIYAIILGFVFLKEKITKKQLIAIIVMLVGFALMQVAEIASQIRIGDLLILSATILWAVENTIAKKAMLNKESNWVVTFSRMFFGALILFSVIFLTKKTNLFLSLTNQQLLYIAISGGILFLYVLTWYWGLKYINLSKASSILLISPVISLLAGMIFLKEPVNWDGI